MNAFQQHVFSSFASRNEHLTVPHRHDVLPICDTEHKEIQACQQTFTVHCVKVGGDWNRLKTVPNCGLSINTAELSGCVTAVC